MLTIKNWQSLSASDKKLCLTRPINNSSVKKNVTDIIKQVRSFGDKALFELTERFDGARLASLQITREQINNAKISQATLAAMNQAIQTIIAYHQGDLNVYS